MIALYLYLPHIMWGSRCYRGKGSYSLSWGRALSETPSTSSGSYMSVRSFTKGY